MPTQRERTNAELLWEFFRTYDPNKPIWKQQAPSFRPGATAEWEDPNKPKVELRPPATGATGGWEDQPAEVTEWSPPGPTTDYSQATSLALPPAAPPSPATPALQSPMPAAQPAGYGEAKSLGHAPQPAASPSPIAAVQPQRQTSLAAPASIQGPEQAPIPKQQPIPASDEGDDAPESESPADKYMREFAEYISSGGRRSMGKNALQQRKSDAQRAAILGALASLAQNAGRAKTWGDIGSSVATSLAQGVAGHQNAPYEVEDEQARRDDEDMRNRLAAASALSLQDYRNKTLAAQKREHDLVRAAHKEDLAARLTDSERDRESQISLQLMREKGMDRRTADEHATQLIIANRRAATTGETAAAKTEDGNYKKFVEERKFLTEMNDPMKNIGNPEWKLKSEAEIDAIARQRSGYTGGLTQPSAPQAQWYSGTAAPPAFPGAKQAPDGRWYDPATSRYIMAGQR